MRTKTQLYVVDVKIVKIYCYRVSVLCYNEELKANQAIKTIFQQVELRSLLPDTIVGLRRGDDVGRVEITFAASPYTVSRSGSQSYTTLCRNEIARGAYSKQVVLLEDHEIAA